MANVLFVGSGGGSLAISSASRKGLGNFHVADPDIVTPSNLNRQLYTTKNLYKNKAIELCKNLSKENVLGSTFHAHPVAVQDLDMVSLKPDCLFSAVDNRYPDTRLNLCKQANQLGVPYIDMAASTDADYGYVFVQEPGRACWSCAFKPEMNAASNEECPNTAASIDILMVLAGQALYALDTLLMSRKRDWNYRAVSLSKSDFGSSTVVKKRSSCPVCGGGK